MVGQRVVVKPSRSDEILDPDQQLQIADQVRAQFDALAPKRPAKPDRSEPYSTPLIPAGEIPIPELDKLRSLQSQAVFLETEKAEQEEFVETHYYEELVSIDKQHHTTGTGFIKVVSEADKNGYEFQLNQAKENGSNGFKTAVFKTNPATNDWIPSVENEVKLSSSKPNRSEGD